MPEFVDTSAPGECIFCKLVAGEIPSARVWEDEQIIVFMDIGHVTPGHMLVTLKRHAATLFDLDEDEAAAVMRVAHRMARAARQAFHPEGMNLLQNNGAVAWQTVGHFHLHIVPRHRDDGVGLVWPAKAPDPELMDRHAERIRRALAQIESV